MPLSVNWALWPNLPDVFGALLVVSILLSRRKVGLHPFSRRTFRDLSWIEIFFVLNVLLVTVPVSTTGEGIRYGGYSVLIFGKYIAVYWATCHIPLDRSRIKALHIGALVAFSWLTLSTLADRVGAIDLDSFTSHLPLASAGKWATVGLNSTVSNTHGQTAVVVFLLAGLVIATARYRMSWVTEAVVLAMAVTTVFFTGSRQGLVRVLVFALVLLMKDSKRLVLVMGLTLAGGAIASLFLGPQQLTDSPSAAPYIERQAVLLSDPFSNEGLSGRPQLWASVLSTLSEKPWRWIIGYGMGNYVEHQNSAHNMILGWLQDGGLLEVMVVGGLWFRIFRRIWHIRSVAWPLVAMSAGLLSSVMTSGILMPNLATGWYLGLFFVSFHIVPRLAEIKVPGGVPLAANTKFVRG